MDFGDGFWCSHLEVDVLGANLRWKGQVVVDVKLDPTCYLVSVIMNSKLKQ